MEDRDQIIADWARGYIEECGSNRFSDIDPSDFSWICEAYLNESVPANSVKAYRLSLFTQDLMPVRDLFGA